jgi:acetyl-CoA carboxylase biotin carboxyl carrier protein
MAERPVTESPVDQVRVLMEEFHRSGTGTLHLRSGAFELLLSSDPNVPSILGAGRQAAAQLPVSAIATVAAPTPPHPVAAKDIPDGAVVIGAPNLGTFYRAPKPGMAPYVAVGERVAPGQEICLIEVMKLFTAVRADRAGTIVAILAEDGAMVEAGQPLFALAAD